MTLKNGLYHITNEGTKQRLDVKNDGTVYVHEPNDGTNQDWELIQIDPSVDNCFKIKSKGKENFLTMKEKKVSLDLEKGDNKESQTWILNQISDIYQLQNLATGAVLDGNSTEVYGHDSNDGNFQKWRFQPLPK